MTTAPAMALPIETGIMFFTQVSAMVIGPPARTPAGKRNMLATECSNPMATNIEIGNQIPTILPVKSEAEVARNTAMHTSQLHMIAFTKVGPNGNEHFATTVFTASVAVPPERSPVYHVMSAIKPQPMTLPTKESSQLLIRRSSDTLPSQRAMDTVAVFPVKSCPPLCNTKRRLTGNSAAKTNFWRPYTCEAAPMLPLMANESKPAIPT
mmetsp:Transcript_50769/g.142095  ORF Transcript_50769/g.142095 Transcript_50769/m.142095 type:complete len:209 (-) Transcript_50769:512-1138(-)